MYLLEPGDLSSDASSTMSEPETTLKLFQLPHLRWPHLSAPLQGGLGLIGDLIVRLVQDLVYSRCAENISGAGHWLSTWALESDCQV